MNRTLAVVILLAGLGEIARAEDAPVIKDNSFLIEEAYNQEAGITQSIVTVQHFTSFNPHWGIAYTQEVPISGMRHQLSWTVPFVSVNDRDHLGIGDVAAHYRLQAMDGSNGLAISPRLSVFFPTGNEFDRGEGVVWYQTNLPVSIELNKSFVLHLNGGTTFIPARILDIYESRGYVYHDLTSYSVGGSIVWLWRNNANFLCEVIHSNSEEIVLIDDTDRFSETIINPGVRVAINRPFGQIVPGIAAPVRFAHDQICLGFFGYLSFEYAY